MQYSSCVKSTHWLVILYKPVYIQVFTDSLCWCGKDKIVFIKTSNRDRVRVW